MVEPLPVQCLDSFQDLVSALRIYGYRWLIHDDQPWFVSDPAGNVQSAQKTSGKLPGMHFPKIFQACKFNGFLHQLFSSFLVSYVKAAEIINIFLYCQFLKNGYILKHDADLFFNLIAVRFHLFPENFHLTSVVFQQGQQTADGRCFSGTVGAKQSKDLTFPDIQIQMIQCGKITIPFYQIFYVNHTLWHIFFLLFHSPLNGTFLFYLRNLYFFYDAIITFSSVCSKCGMSLTADDKCHVFCKKTDFSFAGKELVYYNENTLL